jgi:hypothetical protein
MQQEAKSFALLKASKLQTKTKINAKTKKLAAE